MHQSEPQTTIHLPTMPDRKGFSALSSSEMAASGAILALLVLALLPMMLDSSRMGSGSLKRAMEKPRSVAQASSRLARHYSLVWLSTEGGERRMRLTIVALELGAILGGAAAGQAATSTQLRGGSALRLAGAGKIRARAALVGSGDML
jgi:hypothetical protein